MIAFCTSTNKIWLLTAVFLITSLLQSLPCKAGDGYHVCDELTPENNMEFLRLENGAMQYRFGGRLKCHYHSNYKAFHNLPHNGADNFGSYRVKATVINSGQQVMGQSISKVHEQVWINMPGIPGSSPAIDTTYTCMRNPFTKAPAVCTIQSRSYPFQNRWTGAVRKAAGFKKPLSAGLTHLPVNKSAQSQHQQEGKPEDLFDPDNTRPALVSDITLTNHKFSGNSRHYVFSLSGRQGCIDTHQTGTNTPCEEYKLTATANKDADSQKVRISIKGGGHFVDLTYRCDNIMDPFLDPSNSCHLTNAPSSFTDSLERDLVRQKYPLVLLFANAVPGGQRQPMIWEALAKSMQPKIFEAGKAAPASGKEASFNSSAELMLSVESARDIKRSGDQAVFFFIQAKNAQPVRDTFGNTLSFPLTSKYTGSGYNTTSQTVQNLMPGKYTFYTQIAANLTTLVASKKIPFTVNSDVNPNQTPVIVRPKEDETVAKSHAVPIRVMVSKPMFGTPVDAEVEVEKSPSGDQGSYTTYFTKTNQNIYGGSEVGIELGGVETGYYRVRAQMLLKGKPIGKWSQWRHFQVTGPHHMPHKAFCILAPAQDMTYTNAIPVRIALPKGEKEGQWISLFWSEITEKGPRTILHEQVKSQTAGALDMNKRVAELIAKAGGSISGKIKLRASLMSTNRQDSVVFSTGQLGQAMQWGDHGKKMSGTMDLDHPIILAPAGGYIFRAPATVAVKALHQNEEQVSFSLQYCPVSNNKFAILHYHPQSITPAQVTRKKGETTATYKLDKPGFWRVQATNTDKLAFSSNWREFKVDTLNTKITSSMKTIPAAIQMRTTALQATGIKRHYLAPATVQITLQNAIHSRVPFDLRYRSAKNSSFTQMKQHTVRFSRTGNQTKATFTLKQAGDYQVRFRTNYKSPWTPWQSFSVGNISHVAQRIKATGLHGNPAVIPAAMSVPVDARAINPQPEPPGKQMRIRSGQPTGQSKLHTINTKKPARHIRPAPPKIASPKNGRKFLLTGKNLHIKAEISHAAGQRLVANVQYKDKGRFDRLKSVVIMRSNKKETKTTIDMEITKTGNYRLRVRPIAKDARWGNWRNFSVDRLLKKMPRMKAPATTTHAKPAATHPVIQLQPGLQKIR